MFGVISIMGAYHAALAVLVFFIIGADLENPVTIYEHNLWIARAEMGFAALIVGLSIGGLCLLLRSLRRDLNLHDQQKRHQKKM